MNWVNVKERLPEHHETILAFSPQGFCVVVFVDSRHVNENLAKHGYLNECVDLEKNPYYFCSQERKGHTLADVTHWANLEHPK